MTPMNELVACTTEPLTKPLHATYLPIICMHTIYTNIYYHSFDSKRKHISTRYLHPTISIITIKSSSTNLTVGGPLLSFIPEKQLETGCVWVGPNYRISLSSQWSNCEELVFHSQILLSSILEHEFVYIGNWCEHSMSTGDEHTLTCFECWK